MTHLFLFHPGGWHGYGKISFTESPTQLRFYVKWIITMNEQGRLFCKQQIETETIEPQVHFYQFEKTSDNKLNLTYLSDENLFSGTGTVDTDFISWEFPPQAVDNAVMHGSERYHLQSNGEYLFEAKYGDGKAFRTFAEGRLWRKGST